MEREALNSHLLGTLDAAHLMEFNPLQEAVITRIKQGGDAVLVAEKESGKTTAAAIAAVIKAPKAFEGAPRVLILSPTVDSVHQLHKTLSEWVKRTEIAVEIAHDKGNMVLERNNIFEGCDILVGNARRIHDLYIQNGFHVGQLSLFIIDDAAAVLKDGTSAQFVQRVAESLPRCQRMLFTDKETPRVEKAIETICTNPKYLEF